MWAFLVFCLSVYIIGFWATLGLMALYIAVVLAVAFMAAVKS